jgi:tetratricopeptide (TPR) repeat protein
VEIVTVALDTGGAASAGRYIEAARPQHPSLIDRGHICDDLLGIVNVPSSVWIDETGTIVRPAEPAWPGSTPVVDLLPTLTAELPPERKVVIDEIKRFHIAPETTVMMLRDWAEHGADSKYALAPDEVIARSRPRGLDEATAAARFELGQHLYQRGDHDAAVVHWREAHRLDPANWTYKRQAWSLESTDTTGTLERYGTGWLESVREIGPEQYYPEIRP